MNDAYARAMEQAWSVYYVLRHQETMTLLQLGQAVAALTAAGDYLQQALASQGDQDVQEVYEEAVTGTAQCLAGLSALRDDSLSLEEAAAATVSASQYRQFLQCLYWL